MVPRLSSRSDRSDGRGKSFRDLSAYLFTGDKDNPDPSRAPWAEALNCHCSDPSQAWAEMAWTHQHADDLKQAAGARRGGQKNEFPVWHVSLNWRDDQQPDRATMMEAARGLLKRFGLEDHQALAICHTDTAHDHLHLMVNTVNPHTGRTVDVSRSTKLRLSAWARDYERDHGPIQCQRREENWKAREANKAMHGLWRSMGAQNPDLGTARLRATYDKSDSRPLWQFKQQARDAGIAADDMPKATAMFRQVWGDYYAAKRAGEQTADRPPTDPAAILGRITRAQSTFTREDLARAVNAVTGNSTEFTDTFHRVLALPDLRTLPGEASKPRYSTEAIIRTETEMAHAADALAATIAHGLKAGALAKTDHFSADQRAALDHVTTDSGLACVVGYSGTGKSTMLGAARELWTQSGYTVRGLALAGKAAEGLQDGSGIESTTIRRFLNGLESGRVKIGRKDVIVLDEAGMVGSNQMHALLTAAEKAGAKMVLVGDHGQLQAIEAGGAFRAIVERAGAATLTTIRRQRDELHQIATTALAEGRVEDALRLYAGESRKTVQAHTDKTDAVRGVVEAWAGELDKTGSSIMLAATNRDVASLNVEARAAMRAAGRLAAESRVIRAREENMDKPSRDFNLPVAVGERLLFTKNDARLGVMRGTLGTLEQIEDGRLSVVLDNGRRVGVNLSTYRNLAHGYALTVHKAQGISVDRAHVLAGRSMDRHSAYVALTRHRDSVRLHYSRTDAHDLKSLGRVLGRDRPKDTTLDYTKPPKRLAHQVREDRAARSMLASELSRVIGGGRAARESTRPTDQFRNAGRGSNWTAPQFGRER